MKTINIKRTVLCFSLALLMSLSSITIAHATTVTTDPIGSAGGYTLYVRKSWGTDVLGTLYFNKSSSSKVYSTFTASTKCKAIAYVSNKNTGYKASNGGNYTSLSKGASTTATKSGSGFTKAWAYCSVQY